MTSYRLEITPITGGNWWNRKTELFYCIIKKKVSEVFVSCWTDGGEYKTFTNERVVFKTKDSSEALKKIHELRGLEDV